MKVKILTIAISLLPFLGYAQSDQDNLDKYWKFRNAFRQDFIRIGELRGESLPMGRRGFRKCPNNTPGEFGVPKGKLYWGDGVIRHGHYIGFLATEYALMQKSDQDVTATLNELYYALGAFNRLDSLAEPIISEFSDNIQNQTPNLNGYYLRDDVPQFFDQHWKDEPIQARATAGLYGNNNTEHINDPNATWAEDVLNYAREKVTPWSIPSLDQMTSMLVGLRVCHKLLPDGLVIQPTPNDDPVDLKYEVEQITKRLIDYGKDHNWFLLNMNGWPVGNDGGEMIFNAYPIALIGKEITSIDYLLDLDMTRRINQEYKIPRDYFQLQTQTKRDSYYNSLSNSDQGKIDYFIDNYTNNWPGGLSDFEQWQLDTGLFNVNVIFNGNITQNFWTVLQLKWPDLYLDWQDNYRFDNHFPSPLSAISFDEMNFTDYNNTILFNLGVASGLFDKLIAKSWEDATKNSQLALIQALLTNDTPVNSQALYQGMLNSMPTYGPFKFKSDVTNPSSPPFLGSTYYPSISQVVYPFYWGSEYRWTGPDEFNSIAGTAFGGQYTAMDYMYLHNLYYLVFDNNLPEFEEEYSCICTGFDTNALAKTFVYDGIIFEEVTNPDGSISSDTVQDQKDYIDSIRQVAAANSGLLPGILNKVNDLDPCMNNAFSQFSNHELSSTFLLDQLHDNYEAMGIWLNNYQTETFTVKPSGQLDVESRMVVCENKTLMVEPGGKVNILSGEIRVNKYAELIIEGTVIIEEGTKLILENNSRLQIKSGGVLHNKGLIEVRDDAIIEFYDGGELIMDKNDSELKFNGGDLLVKTNAHFEPMHINSTESGHIRISKDANISGEANSTLRIAGKNINSELLILEGGTILRFDTPNDLKQINFAKGKVLFHDESTLEVTNPFTTSSINFERVDVLDNCVIKTLNKTHISSTELNDVKLIANQGGFADARLTMTYSDVNYSGNNIAVHVTGKKALIYSTDFNLTGLTGLGLLTNSLNHPSTVIYSNFRGNLNSTLIQDYSVPLFTIKKSNFDVSKVGIQKIDGALGLRCNTFDSLKFNVSSENNATLQMTSVHNKFGYNTFANTEQGSLLFWYANVPQLIDGNNDFASSVSGKFFKGHFFPYLNSLLLGATQNGWSNTVPLANNFSLSNSNNQSQSIGVNFANSQTGYCGQYDTPIDPLTTLIPKMNGYSTESTLNPDIVVSGYNDNAAKPLDVIIGDAMKMSEFYDTINGDNTSSLDLFHKIMTNDYTGYTLDSNQLTIAFDYAFEQMKYTLYDAFDKGQITIAGNQTAFDPLVTKYVDATNKYSQYLQARDEKIPLFFHEMEKVHLYRLIGHPSIALSFLHNAEYCGLDSLEQAYVNHWKFSISEEMAKVNYGYEAFLMDTVFTDTSAYTLPADNGDMSYAFGSTINSLFGISYQTGCGGQSNSTSTNLPTRALNIYPNPGHDILNIGYSLKEEESATVKIFDLSGKLLTTLTLSPWNTGVTTDISKYTNGIYVYSYYVNNELIETGKFTKQ